MEVKEVDAAEMVAEEEAVGMEDLSVGVVAYPHPPPLLSLFSREEAVGSKETIKPFDQQGNAGGSRNFFADHQQKECGGSAEMAAKEVEVAEMEAEDDAAKEAVVGSIPMAAEAIGIQEVIGIVCNNITSKRHSCHSPCLFGVSAEEVPLDVTENVADADDENLADTDDVTKSRAPPAGKLGFKGKRAKNNLDAVSRGAVNRRPAGPVFFLRPNRFRPLSMTHPTLLWHLVLVLQNARSPRSNLFNNLDKQLDS
jgi:hypothetical protein